MSPKVKCVIPVSVAPEVISGLQDFAKKEGSGLKAMKIKDITDI